MDIPPHLLPCALARFRAAVRPPRPPPPNTPWKPGMPRTISPPASASLQERMSSVVFFPNFLLFFHASTLLLYARFSLLPASLCPFLYADLVGAPAFGKRRFIGRDWSCCSLFSLSYFTCSAEKRDCSAPSLTWGQYYIFLPPRHSTIFQCEHGEE
ncbi:hypothetical protein SEVIR_9G347766v4 [Setaria viridis]|uniref:Uncharacterized protein n=1 Tax=Setaria viridis TaxID=4556 RepID=A0A4U6T113_SETVI|nr:hypothetical protein SEVIR_9G347766v2 [Setaria viridis]